MGKRELAWIANIEFIHKGGGHESYIAWIANIEIIRNRGKRKLAWIANIE